MYKTTLIIASVCLFFSISAQTKVVGVEFNGIYTIGENLNPKNYQTVLYDSIFYPENNFTLIRVLTFGGNDSLFYSLSHGNNYQFTIQRKLQHFVGCREQLSEYKLDRSITDKGSFFESQFLQKQLEINPTEPCDFMAIEIYYILQLEEKNIGNNRNPLVLSPDSE